MTRSKAIVNIRADIICAKSGKIRKCGDWIKNLIFDSGLNLLAGNTSPGYAGFFSYCKIGSGNAPNFINSGAVTFTQSGNVITASSAGWFTTNSIPINSLFKYGTGSGGAEQYIVSIGGGGTTATVSGSGMSVVIGTVATVWFVQQTGLAGYLFNSNSYVTGGGCGTSFSGNVITLQRTYRFPVQGSNYTVNEIGYVDTAVSNPTTNGRVVLPSPDTVLTTEFYQVVIQISWTVTPSAPTAVLNVGTNINTAGQVMIQNWSCSIVDTNGNNQDYQGGTYGSMMDYGTGVFALHTGAAITLQPSIQASPGATSSEPYLAGLNSFSNVSQPPGVGVSITNFTFTTAAESLNAIVWGGFFPGNIMQIFVLNLTTPVTLPSGSYAGSLTFTRSFGRILVN